MVCDLRLDRERLRLTLANDLGEIEAALPHLQAFGEAAGLGPKLQNRLEVVFEELVSNAIRHGFTPGSAQTLHVRAEVGGEGLTLVIEDDGAPFDPLARPEPAALTDIATAPVGGLGISLVAKLAARFHYEPADGAEGGFRPVNRVTVVLAL
jgi:serine/threonine-protein kinase RsbW